VTPTPREKVVILGGGMAALTAAFELSRPGWRDRFQSITVHQMGWRLGGKGASGRGLHDRIEEHGLHLWLGFYENAFRLLQECYAELGRPAGAPLARWDDALKKASFVVLEEWHDGAWKHWPISYPEDDRVPGVRDPNDRPVAIWDYLKRGLELMVSLTRDAGLPADPAHAGLQAAVSLAAGLPDDPAAHDRAHHGALAETLDVFKGWFGRSLPRTDRARRLGALIEIIGAAIRGILRDGVLTHGLAAIDDEDFIKWLKRHGASDEAVSSPVLRGGYDLAFAFRDGDPARPALAAGQAVLSSMRFFFAYKGAIFWKMQAGMGDTVFAPLYLVLKARGVDFRFFHRVKNLRLSPDRRTIAAVEIARQVDLLDEAAGYDPLVDVDGLPSWPSEPRREQIRDGEQLRGHNLESFWDPWPDRGALTLRAGEDFDRLIFGISLGSVPYVCRELVEHSVPWQDMVKHVKTVQTQALQLWLTADAAELGWPLEQADLSGWVEPFDTYADMRQLLPLERWPAPRRPRSIAYFCNVMATPDPLPAPPDPAFAAAADAQVRQSSIDFLRREVGHLWPRAMDPRTGDFRWELLVSDDETKGVERLASQFWRANVDPSERYVQSLPGTGRYRLRTDRTGYPNLYIVGDWIDTSFNVGCVEAAVMSGLLASHAISGRPPLEDIVGYRHP
jgi:uncharacterized protein with NAD-binding domain and iron-sulfur cluster